MQGAFEPQSDVEVLASVEVITKLRGRSLAFPHWLERRFEADTGARYAKVMAGDLKRAVIFYNLFIFGDFLLAPDAVGLAIALHAFVVTPTLLALAWLLRRPLPPLTRDIIGASAPLAIVFQILCVFSVTRAPTAAHYFYFVALSVVIVNTALRARHRSAAWSTAATFAAMIVTLVVTQKTPLDVAVMQVISIGLSGVVTLRGIADREREYRRAYLAGLRDRLKIAATDAEANRDALTGVANRRGLEIAARAIWSGAAPKAPVAVIMFDIDKFKAFNDLYGHPAGDACLKAIAAGVLPLVRGRDDLLARFGGEEFLALLTGEAAGQAEAIAERMRRAVLALKVRHAGSPDRGLVSASFGVAAGRVGEIGFEALTAAADEALYAAKAAGRNNVTRALAA